MQHWAKVCIAAAAWTSMASADVPATLSHQGVITVNGQRFTGNGDFRFAVVVPSNGQYRWTNDDSALANCTGTDCPPPTTAVPLIVINGVFNVSLGSAGMVPFAASVFNVPDLAVRVWFDDGVHGIHQLAPDMPIDSVAFAFRAATIDDNAVGTDQIVDGQVTNADLANNAVNSAKIQDATVTAADLAANSVDSSEIAANAVGNSEIAAGAVTNSKIGTNAITESKIAPNAVTTGKIGNGQVINADLASNAVTGAKIQDGTITAADLASSSVQAAEIAAGAVGTSEIANGAVGNADLANNAVNGAKIANSTVTAVDLSDEPGVAAATLAGNVTLGQNFSSMVARTISVPASGFVLAIGTVYMDLTNGLTTAIGVCGLSTSSNSLADGNEYVVVADGTVTVHDIFSVNAGNNTFFFVGQNILSGTSTITASSRHISLAYFPTSYGTVTATEGDTDAFENAIFETDEQADFDIAGYDNDYDEFIRNADPTNELLERLAAMEQRIHELERNSEAATP